MTTEQPQQRTWSEYFSSLNPLKSNPAEEIKAAQAKVIEEEQKLAQAKATLEAANAKSAQQQAAPATATVSGGKKRKTSKGKKSKTRKTAKKYGFNISKWNPFKK